MLKKSLCLLSAFTLLGACSHHQPKKTQSNYKVSRSFLEIIKSKKPGKPQEQRFPAAAKSIPGLAEFMKALKANPRFLKAPVGHEVITESTGKYEGQEWKSLMTSTFLKQELDGHFSLENSDDAGDEFHLYEAQRIENVEADLAAQDYIREIKKLSGTKYLMSFTVPSSGVEASCEVLIDLAKSSDLSDSKCVDDSGNIISQSKVISVKAIKPQDYAKRISSIKLNAHPNALDCSDASPELECFDSVIDESEKDWSYLLK